MKKLLKALAVLLTVILAVAAGYIIYLFASYERIDDNQILDVTDNTDSMLTTGEPHTIVTWNLGFGAYSDDYSFFMDGGTESRAYSREAVLENIGGAIEGLKALNADLMLLQEIDFGSTRSYQVDQCALITDAFPDRTSVFAQNYSSAYLAYPFTEPHGASKSGILTLSCANIQTAVRRSVPVESGFMKFFDLDRCYSVSVIPTDSGHPLCLYNLHLSAYTSDGTIATEQLTMMLAQMEADYQSGCYVIAGGDFNKDLPGNSPEIFGVSGANYMWAQPFPQELLPDGFSLADSVDTANPVPSCRNTDKPYSPGETFVLTVDGFIVSDNVQILNARVEDEAFAHSDHNPVTLEFILQH